MRAWSGSTLAIALVTCIAAVPVLAADSPGTTPSEALSRLKEGNARFAAGKPMPAPLGAARRTELVGEQHPFAIVLSCADSRVPPEHVFNVGLGDLFVIRTAGEVTDHAVLASVEYAVEHLHVPLLLVMGHASCGAVTAASEAHKDSLGPNLDYLVNAIHPAIEHTASAPAETRLKAAILDNVTQVINDALGHSAIIKSAVQHGHLQLIGGFYDLATGAVTFTKPVTAESLGASHTTQ